MRQQQAAAPGDGGGDEPLELRLAVPLLLGGRGLVQEEFEQRHLLPTCRQPLDVQSNRGDLWCPTRNCPSSSASPSAGVIMDTPTRSARFSTARTAAAPTPDQGPQLMLKAGRPRDQAKSGQGVQKRVGGGVIGLTCGAEERGRGRKQDEIVELILQCGRCRFQAPIILGAKTRRNLSGDWVSTKPSSSKPAR